MEPIELPDELVNIRHTNIYKTPDGYFTNLADEIMGKIYVPISSKTSMSEPPANYFADLADAILHKIKSKEAVAHTEVEKELHHIEPLLTSIPKTNVYTVPEGYFDNFTVAVGVKKPARIIRMRHSSKWFTSAAAAVVTGVIAVSIIFSARDNSSTIASGSSYSQTLSKVSDKEISNYLLTTSPEPDATLNLLEDNTPSSDGNLKSLLNNVSDNELHNYLSQNDDVR